MVTMELTPRQREVLAAILGRALGESSAALSEMVECGMMLSVAAISAVPADDLVERLAGGAGSRPVVAVRQVFSGQLGGKAMLVFGERQSLSLTRALLSDTVPLEMMTDLDHDALVEVGNVVINSFLAGIARELTLSLASGLPDYRRGLPEVLLPEVQLPEVLLAATPTPESDADVLVADLDVRLGDEDVDGCLLVTLDQLSSAVFRERIDNPSQKA